MREASKNLHFIASGFRITLSKAIYDDAFCTHHRDSPYLIAQKFRLTYSNCHHLGHSPYCSQLNRLPNASLHHHRRSYRDSPYLDVLNFDWLVNTGSTSFSRRQRVVHRIDCMSFFDVSHGRRRGCTLFPDWMTRQCVAFFGLSDPRLCDMVCRTYSANWRPSLDIRNFKLETIRA